MKKNINKVFIIALCAIVLIPNSIFAKEFNDVKKDGPYGWAYPYIDVLSNRGIVSGYPDGDYKPDRAVSFEEVHQLLKGIINPSKSEIDDAMEKYGSDIEKYGVADWAKEAIAISLYNKTIGINILKEADKQNFIGNDIERYPDRNTVCVYFAKALKMSKDGDIDLLKHKDKDKIPTEVRGYLASLIKAGIFSDSGSDGKFDGNRFIKRSEMAKITKLSYDYVKKADLKNEQVLKMEGDIVIADKINNIDTLIIENSNKKYQFRLDSNTKFKPSSLSFLDIKVGQKVSIEYIKDEDLAYTGKVKVIEINDKSRKLVGYVNSSSDREFNVDYAENTSTLDLTKVDKVRVDKTSSFKLENDVTIYSLGKKIKARDLYMDDLVEFDVNNEDRVTDVLVYPKNGKVTGKIESITEPTSKKIGSIVLKLSDDKKYTFYTEEYRYSSRIFDRLRVGDSVTFNTKYKVVFSLEDNKNSNIEIGKIVRVDEDSFYSGVNWKVVLRTSREDLNLYTDRNTVIINGGAKSIIRDKDIIYGKYVRVVLDGKYIMSIEFIDYDSTFNVVCQVLDIKNRSGFSSFYETEYTVKIIESDNKKLKLGSREVIKVDNPSKLLSKYDLFRMNGIVDDRGNFEINSNLEFISSEDREVNSSSIYNR